MPMKMSFTEDEMKGPKPVPNGIYTVRLKGFRQKLSKGKDSVNLNPIVEIIEPSEHSEGKIYTNLNTKIPGFIQDFTHSFGLEMEPDGNGGVQMPGEFDGPAGEKDIEKMKYVGPLVGCTAQWEVGTRNYEGREQNEVLKFICAVPDCAVRFPDIKHSNNMGQKSS